MEATMPTPRAIRANRMSLIQVAGSKIAAMCRAENDGRHERNFVGLENVGGHTRAVTDVVANVVGDRGGVAGIVFGDSCFDLPTRSAPTSAAFVKMPPPTRMKSAASDPPKPNPIRSSWRPGHQRQG